jgi:hypothetical protein
MMMASLVDTASDMISFRIKELPAGRLPERTAALVQACKERPTPRNIATLAWDLIEDVLAVTIPNHRLPGPADPKSLEGLSAAIRRQFACEPPEVLLELLAHHDGIRMSDPSSDLAHCTALYSSSEMTAMLTVLEDVDRTLLPISGNLSGDHAVVRLAASTPDHGAVYAFWHEDFPEDGLEPMARNAAEYLMFASAHVVETISDFYRGPTL